MRIPESTIKAAILHPEAAVRMTALQYFAESHTDDPSIMPLAIQAVERYRGRMAFEFLYYADHLPQTPATVDWAISQLRHPFNAKDHDEDNMRFVLARMLLEADPGLLARRHDDIKSLRNFPKELRGLLDEALRWEFADWPTLWTAFEELGRKAMVKGVPTLTTNQHFHRLTKAMARHPKDGADVVLDLLHRLHSHYDNPIMLWLEPRLVRLAGRMKLTAAVPLLLERLDDDIEDLQYDISEALTHIGGDGVVEAVFQKWQNTDVESQITLIQPLECIHSDLALQRTLWLLEREEDFDMRMALALAAVGHFAPESIEPVREVLLEEKAKESGEYWDLRHQLVATATIMVELFPEYGEWHDEALETDYGFETIKDKIAPFRMADAYTEDKPPKPAKRSRAKTVYQLKITLKEIKPPIWRRILVEDCRLDDLHEIIQIAMGWENYHLYAFKIGDEEFTDPEMDAGEMNMDDATATKLSDVVIREKQKFIYQYDFGDNWMHEVVVEKIGQPEEGQKYPVCLKGSRACPPEDVGGPWSYPEYLEALVDSDHERHEEYLQWRGKFDAEAFNLDAVNKALRKMFR